MTEQVTEGTAEVIKRLAYAAREPSELEPGSYYAWIAPTGQLHQVDLTGDAYRNQPRRKKGTVTVRDVASLAHYYQRHHDLDSETFADLDAGKFTVVLDAHKTNIDEEDESGGDGARWEQHRVILELQTTLPWRTWLAHDRQWFSQQEFAEFLEDNCRDLAADGPVSAADLLEVAQHFQAKNTVTFSGGTRLATGQTQFTYAETIDAKAGNRGTIEIPAEFALAIVPFEDCMPAIVPARFRYRLNHGDLRLGYFLADPQRIAREAVREIGEKVADALGGITVMQGRPA